MKENHRNEQTVMEWEELYDELQFRLLLLNLIKLFGKFSCIDRQTIVEVERLYRKSLIMLSVFRLIIFLNKFDNFFCSLPFRCLPICIIGFLVINLAPSGELSRLMIALVWLNIFNFIFLNIDVIKKIKKPSYLFFFSQVFADNDEVELHYQLQRDRILKTTSNPLLAKFKIMRLLIWEIGICTLLWQAIAQTQAGKTLNYLWIHLCKNLESSFMFITRR